MITFHTHPAPGLPYGGRRQPPPDLFSAALVVRQVSLAYPHATFPSIRDVSFQLQEGTMTALVGPNGAGKSTLLKAIAGLLQPMSGTITVYGLPPQGCHHRIAYLPQRNEIDWRFPVSVERFVMTGRYVHLGWLKWPRLNDQLIVIRMIERFGLETYRRSQIGELSGGQQQRLLLARAMAQGADLLLLDEPYNHLDAETRSEMQSLFADIRDARKTLIVATHDFDQLRDPFDQVIRIRDGTRAMDGATA